MSAKPRVLFVGHTHYDLPLSRALARKWDALSERLELRVVASARKVTEPDDRFRLLRFRGPRAVEGSAFYTALPAVLAREITRFRAEVIIAQSPFEGLAAITARRFVTNRPAVVIEVHGDWRTAARLYGSPARRLYAAAADRAALYALERADATRALSDYTAGLVRAATGRHPVGVFPAYFDYESFAAGPRAPLPEVATAVWIGALQRGKNVDGFVDGWRIVADRLPQARLVMIGDGPLRPLAERLAADLPGRVELIWELAPPEVARRLDQATVLVLPSLSEGLGRVILEAFMRGRPVVAAAVGGIPDLVMPERNGLLVPPGDVDALADALVRVLHDRALADRLGRAAAEDAKRRPPWSGEQYAEAVTELVDRMLAHE